MLPLKDTLQSNDYNAAFGDDGAHYHDGRHERPFRPDYGSIVPPKDGEVRALNVEINGEVHTFSRCWNNTLKLYV